MQCFLDRRSLRRYVIGITFALGAVSAAEAQLAPIATDGTMGAAVDLPGPDIDIPSTLGTLTGGNLFHSFARFNVPTGGSALFTDPTASSIDNVVSRVTGGETSSIDGLLGLDSTIPNADLFLINPAGVVFGPNATIDVPGSFHVGTADFIAFPDGQFNATTPAGTVLSTAPPSAFGFLDANPADVVVNGSILLAPSGETLSVVAGDITVSNNAVLGGAPAFAEPGASVLLVGVDSPGQLAFATPRDTSSFAALGNVTVDSSVIVNDFFGSGFGGGSIAIRGGDVVVTNSIIKTTSLFFDGGDIDIAASGQLRVLNISDIVTETPLIGIGRAGDIRLEGNSLVIDNLSFVSSRNLGSTFVFGGFEFVPRGGDVFLTGFESILISDGFEIGTFAGFPSDGDAGNVFVNSDGPIVVNDTTIGSQSLGNGRAGDLTVDAGSLTLTNDASLDSSSFSSRTGEIVINASDVVSLDTFSNIVTFSIFGDTGGISISTPGALNIDDGSLSVLGGDENVGAILIDVGSLRVTGNSLIGPSNAGPAPGGDIAIIALQSAEFIAEEPGDLISISSGASPAGPGGNISINTSDLVISGNVLVAANTGFDGGSQDGGTMTFDVDRLVIDRGAIITSSTLAGGNAGGIDITASESVTLSGTGPGGAPTSLASISLAVFSTTSGNPGFINISAPLVTIDQALLTADNDSGDLGGNVIIDTGTLLLTSSASIGASTVGTGPGGSVIITASDLVSVDGGSGILASTLAEGPAGVLSITAPELRVDGGSGIGVGSISVDTQPGPASGDGGELFIDVGKLFIQDGSISAQTDNVGAGGSITITANSIELGPDGKIRSDSKGTGDAGNIIIDSGTQFFSQGGLIQTSTDVADGGNIELNADLLIFLVDSSITTSVGAGLGDGGNISIGPDADFLVLDGSLIQANAFGGNGGNITIVVGQLLTTPESLVEASSALGIDGTVNISSPDSDISGDLTVLPAGLVDVVNLLAQRCAARGARAMSSLVGVGRGGLPGDPGRPLSGSFSVVPVNAGGAAAIEPAGGRQTARLYLRLSCSV